MSLPFDPQERRVLVGIEIHQQLAASTKLFCSCPTLKSEALPFSFERRLRPVQSELGRLDPAAVFEFNKGRVNRYRWSPESSCLVEADDEPPHPLNAHALETVVLISLMLGSNVVDEVHVMRKIVIDGSNTSGFQRTAVVGLGGLLPYDGRSVGVQSITVEEDSSRVLGEESDARVYALDRLGVPLVEIALDPIAGAPEDVEAAALSLGRLLRSTGRAARGLGTIRQDLNISVMGGEVVEVKGVQKLNLIAKVVRYEAVRQMGMIRIAEEIAARTKASGSGGAVVVRTSDVTSVFRSTSSPVLGRVLEAGVGARVYCVAAEGLAGLLGLEPYPGIRLGKELAEIARANSLGGVIHSDEFRKQKVGEEEESRVRAATGSKEDAGLVLVAGQDEGVVARVAGLVAERLRAAPGGVTKETRASTEDGETRFMRPRPGAARMYPETDIPEIVLTDGTLARIAAGRPTPWEEKVAEYAARYSLSRELALQLYDSDHAALFETLVGRLRSLGPSVVASTLVEMPTRLYREGGIAEGQIGAALLTDLLVALDGGAFAKEAAIDVLRMVAKGEAADVGEAAARLGLKGITDEELQAIIEAAVEKNRGLIAERGERAFSVLMGEVMKSTRGKVDGQKVSRLLRARLASATVG